MTRTQITLALALPVASALLLSAALWMVLVRSHEQSHVALLHDSLEPLAAAVGVAETVERGRAVRPGEGVAH